MGGKGQQFRLISIIKERLSIRFYDKVIFSGIWPNDDCIDCEGIRLNYVVSIGGGKSQLPFILAAAELGFGTIVFDQDSQCPGAKSCDLFYNMSIRDVDALVSSCLSIAQSHQLCGVMTYSSAPAPLRAVAIITDALELPSFSPESLEAVVDKALMKKCFSISGVNTPNWLTTYDEQEALNFYRKTCGTVIVKPSKGSQGSAGVSQVTNEHELSKSIHSARASSQDGFVIVEEFFEGREYSVDGIVVDGKPITMMLSEKHNLGADHGFVMSGFSEQHQDSQADFSLSYSALEKLGHDAVRALEINNSLFSVDIVVKGDTAKVIECGVLLDCKIDRLLHHAGIDIYKHTIQLITGRYQQQDYRRFQKALVLKFLFANKQGRLFTSPPICPESVVIEWERKNGDLVKPPSSIADMIGWAIGLPDDVARLDNDATPLFEVQ